MKKIVILSLFVSFSVATFAQIKEGIIKYNVDLSSKDPALNAQLTMVKGSKMTYQFTDNLARVDLNVGSMSTTSSIFDFNKKVSTTLISSMAGNVATTDSFKDELTKKALYEDAEKTDETKKIKGYLCNKYFLIDENGNSFVVWATKEIQANKDKIIFFQGDFEGFPLEFESAQGDLLMKFTATEITPSLKKVNTKTLFNTDIPKGYTIKTKEEMEAEYED